MLCSVEGALLRVVRGAGGAGECAVGTGAAADRAAVAHGEHSVRLACAACVSVSSTGKSASSNYSTLFTVLQDPLVLALSTGNLKLRAF